MGIYVKYNDNRAKEYQTRTVVKDDPQDAYVEKTPLTKEAEEHINSFPLKKEWSEFLFPEIKSLPCQKIDGGIRYAFLEGKTLDSFIAEKIGDVEDVIAEIKRLFSKYYAINPKAEVTWEKTDEFTKLFGMIDCENEVCVRPANLDMIFENVIIDEKENATAYDYEWTFDFPVPKKYLFYRILAHVYDQYRDDLEHKISLPNLMQRFDIDEKEFGLYALMEERFIAHIYKSDETIFISSEDAKNFDRDVRQIKNENDKLYRLYDEASAKVEQLSFDYEWYRSNAEHEKQQQLLAQSNDFNTRLYEKEVELQAKRGELQNKDRELEDLRNEVNALRVEVQRITGSASWKVTKPLRTVKHALKHDAKPIQPEAPNAENSAATGVNVESSVTTEMTGANADRKDFGQEPTNEKDVIETLEHFYRAYRPTEINQYEHAATKEVLEEQRENADGFSSKIKISVVTPLYNTNPEFLRVMIESVIAQTYSNWEFCLVDFSPRETGEVEQIAREYADKDARIKFVRDYDNKGIAENTNTCIAMATGEYIAILDHDDMLDPTAFYEVMKEIEKGADFIYSDEGKFEGDLDHMMVPYFKNDFAPEELAVHNYICHLNVYKKSLIDEVGGYRKEYDGSQDHDVVLRLTEKAKRIVHIDKLLYYWRMSATSVAANISAKPYATIAGEKAVNEHFKRMGLSYTVSSVRDNIPCYEIDPNVHEERIHVVLWDCENRNDILKSIKSIQRIYEKPFRVSIVGKGTFGLLAEEPAISWAGIYVQDSVELRKDQINNIMNNNKEEYYLFMKAGCEFVSSNPIHALLDYAVMEGVAAVDAFVKYRADYIFSAGVLASESLTPKIQLRGYGHPMSFEGYETDYIHARNVSAVLGVCTMIKKKEWIKIDLGKTVVGNPFVIQSLHACEAGCRLMIDARAKVQANMLPYMQVFSMYQFEPEDIPEKERYFNENIKRFVLE